MPSSVLIPLLLALICAFALYFFWNRQQRKKLEIAVSENAARNAALSQRIETTKARLLASEDARRGLEVANAVSGERERIMRDIHDGIGANLVAALASAERQGKDSSTAVVALKGALADLKIAVDSLEPVDGDIGTLLASLRYRLEPDLRKMGITFDWKVEQLPPLAWLDAPKALHVLRIFQEAISNILRHAKATVIGVHCRLELTQGRPGILVTVSDNGSGFDLAKEAQGHGRNNMQTRAKALDAKLSVTSTPTQGTQTSLWLPLIRANEANAD